MSIDHSLLSKKHNSSIDDEPLNGNRPKGIGIAKKSINQKDFGGTIHEKDISFRDSKESSKVKEIAAEKISMGKGQPLEEKIKENESTLYKLSNTGTRMPTLSEIKNALLKSLGKIISYPTKFRGEIRDKIKNIASNINLLDEKSIIELYKQFIETKGEKTEDEKAKAIKKAREAAVESAAAVVDKKLQEITEGKKKQISQARTRILEKLKKFSNPDPTENKERVNQNSIVDDIKSILKNEDLLDEKLTSYLYNSLEDPLQEIRTILQEIRTILQEMRKIFQEMSTIIQESKENLAKNEDNASEKVYVISSVADVVLARKDLENGKLEYNEKSKSLEEQKIKERWTDQQYKKELGKLIESEGERIRRDVVLSYLKRHKGTGFCLGRFYQDQKGTVDNIKSILNNEILLDEGSIEFLSEKLLTETDRTRKAFAISCVKNIILDEKPNDGKGQNVIAKKDGENDPKFSANFVENKRKIEKLEKLIDDLNNDLKSKKFSEIEKNNIISKIGILGVYTKKLTRVSKRLLKNEHDGKTIENTFTNSKSQIKVGEKQGEKDPYSEKEKNFEIQINSNEKNSKSKKRIKFNDEGNRVFSFDKQDAPEKIPGKSMEDILNNSKKKPGKSILLNYLRPIDAFDDGGTGDIRFDQNTGKIQFGNPYYDEEE